jgi:hypothetical protein
MTSVAPVRLELLRKGGCLDMTSVAPVRLELLWKAGART